MLDEATDALLTSWKLSLHAQRPRTVDLYMREAIRFVAWLVEHDRPEQAAGDLLLVTRQDIEAWLTDLRSQGRAQATLRSRWIVLRNLYGWLVEEDEIPTSPLAKVRVEKGDTPAPVTLSESEIASLLKACAGREFLDRRDTAMVRFMLATGARVSEVTALESADVDLTNRIAVIDGKGGKRRLVRFDPATAAAIDRYLRLRARHPKAGRSGLWISHMGSMTRKGVQPMLVRRAAQAGIRHVHPHMLRHTWADRLKRRGMSDEDLMRLGGWESSEVMRRYGEARAVDRALAAYDEIDPMGDL